MPGIEIQSLQQINKIAVEGPQIFIPEVTNILKWYN